MPTRTLATLGAAALALGLAVGAAPSAFANDTQGACTSSARQALKQEIRSLHEQIDALRLTPAEVAANKVAHRKAVADIRAEYGLPGATLTDAQRAELKARIVALHEQEDQAKAERRAEIDPLKQQLRADRQQLEQCRTDAGTRA